MHLAERFWAGVTIVLNFFTLSPLQDPNNGLQVPLFPSSNVHAGLKKGPIFKPPGGRPSGPGSEFLCDYSAMPDFQICSTPEDRSCWLKNSKTGQRYDINTNYEDTNQTPVGIHRTYYLNISDTTLNADGEIFNEAKLFNLTYPGPWIQGCWGDVCFHLYHSPSARNPASNRPISQFGLRFTKPRV
jgi:hypothetical protein